MNSVGVILSEIITKGQRLCDSTYMRYLKQPASQRQKIEWELLEAMMGRRGWGSAGNELLFHVSRVLVLQDEMRSVDGQW